MSRPQGDLGGGPTTVLLAAAGAGWESAALRGLAEARVVVVKRCVDLADLLATAAAGQTDVAVVAADLPGLDAASVTRLLRDDVRTVAVGDEGMTSLGRIGVAEVVPAEAVADLADAVHRSAARELVVDPDPDPHTLPPEAVAYRRDDDVPGRTVAVWGPAGAPGRTTVAVAVAAELAHRGRRVVLADLDPFGGAVAQTLGVLDEVSGLLAAARLQNAGELDAARFAGTRRLAGGIEVLTGLPRADRWVEVREGVTTDVLALASARGDVVVDTGFCLEDAESGFGGSSGRHRMTLEALLAADEVVVVGSPDPVGLSRLARGLVELADARPGAPVRVVVNRMRDRLGWSEHDIAGMIEGFVRPLGITFLPEDQVACDRALVAGHTLVESGDSALRRAVSLLTEELFPDAVATPSAGGRGRRPWRRTAPGRPGR